MRDNGSTVLDRFQRVTPDEFRGELDRIWQSTAEIKDTIAEQVEQGIVPPLTGLAMVSCVTAQAFGYLQAHGQTTAADLASTLSPTALRT